MPTLYLMRHGQAENSSPDIERQLSRVGKANVTSVAKFLKDKNIHIDQVIYSSAERAKQTAMLMCEGLNIAREKQVEDPRIYNASDAELLTVIIEMDKTLESVLLVGHNPGFADLVLSLCGKSVGLSPGNIAVVQGASWNDIRHCQCRFVEKL